jgi:lipopolysaccharide export system permease protein
LNRLDLYLFRQGLIPFLVAICVITGIVWMTQSLQRADILIEYRQGLQAFAQISLLIIPSLLSVIVPFTLFVSALYALQRLHADSEIAVMFAAGVSRLRIAVPFLALALGAAAATLWINVDLMPRSYRMLKQQVADLRADVASAVLRSGEFIPAGDGYTIYVEEAGAKGTLKGLIVSDYSDPELRTIYMAQRGVLRETPQGSMLFLANGNIQRVSPDTGQIDIASFQTTAINLDRYRRSGGDLQLELTERYLSELFHPNLNDAWDRQNRRALIAEGHGRLAAPIYAFAYVLIALFAVTGGPYNRRSYGLRLLAACAAAGGLRVGGIVLQGFAGAAAPFWTLYALPLVAAALSVALIAGLRPLGAARRLEAQRPGAPA